MSETQEKVQNPEREAVARKPRTCLCLHGHFYQPPRENPWLESIEVQESAAPFHDWNDRIHRECYQPNSRARILDSQGHILNIVNNYERISFNFGPTLLSWIEKNDPGAYLAILDADQKSSAARHGHGNAIAQVYNHVILPLASRRDKVTQVRWGIEDFRHRFGRMPESVWLAETACNEETLEVLIDAGMKYVILAPSQALSVRELGTEAWRDVSQNQIDPKITYRCFPRSQPDRSIDVFFYDGPISKAVGFEDVVFDAKRFMDRVGAAKVEDFPVPQLIHIATDGETYGHHKPFGDRVLAYVTYSEAANRGFTVTNYGEFLEMNPPRHEVRLKDGENGEGTSWSCAHGVRRWKDHCGCRGGGPAEWKQHWRKPLREALDWLRDELAGIFETHGSKWLKDPWLARDEYIEVVLDRTEPAVRRFLESRAHSALNHEDTINCLKLLEMQRNAMLMYTSCGWFFSDISGIETIQILQYASRALQLAFEVGGHSLEKEFLNRLALAKSNIARVGDGRGVYEAYVRPAIVTPHKVAAHFAISSIFEKFPERFSIASYDLEILSQRMESYGTLTLNMGRIKIKSKVTLKENDLVFIVLQFETYDFRCSVKTCDDEVPLSELEEDFFNELHSIHLVELLRKIDDHFGKEYFALKDIFLEERIKIISILTRGSIEKINATYENLYEETRRMNEVYRSINLPVPREISYAIQHTLMRKFEKALLDLAEERFDPARENSVTRILEVGLIFGVQLATERAAEFLTSELARRTEGLAESINQETVEECFHIHRLAGKIGAKLNHGASQEHLFYLIRRWRRYPEMLEHIPAEIRDGIYQLARMLQVNPDGPRNEFDRAAEAK
ncbi:MAG: hypothetical protein A2902_05405 [Elusimicrobia bacterium RIFCSPLOWO2_01_FULL_64_13]|nr:MAG: hypothetical protein A2636_01000 [Elusimicrobia bacterium RIFCSPHIGHO2_01_FULL_64_10]OGR94557.1 MAG: hypothetical protein A2902_05405 [Elusimicrobia bacterium RIFCSPLOWO2_01_FULL_64_13]